MKKRKRDNKPKDFEEGGSGGGGGCSSSKIFKSRVLVLSTIDLQGSSPSVATSLPKHTFKSLSALCLSHGATMGQIIGKNTHCLVTTASARSVGTQKIRKAYKKGCPIVDVGWVESCIGSSKLLPFDDYRCEDSLAGLMAKKEEEREARATVDVQILQDTDVVEDVAGEVGWSEPVSYGCSCVCHENNPGVVTDCDWCTDCSTNLSLRRSVAIKKNNNNK